MIIAQRNSVLSRVALLKAAAGVALALSVVTGAAAPAAAECTGRRLTVNRANATDFACRMNCAVVPSELLLARRDFYGDHDARVCMELCEERRDCAAISWEFTEVGGSLVTRCMLWREGELATFDEGVYTPRMRLPGVCFRRYAPYRDPRLDVNFDRLQPGQYRPGQPGPGSVIPKK